MHVCCSDSSLMPVPVHMLALIHMHVHAHTHTSHMLSLSPDPERPLPWRSLLPLGQPVPLLVISPSFSLNTILYCWGLGWHLAPGTAWSRAVDLEVAAL